MKKIILSLMVVLFTMSTIPAIAGERNRHHYRHPQQHQHQQHNNGGAAFLGLFLGLLGGAIISTQPQYRPRRCDTFYVQEWDPYIRGYKPVPYTRCD